MTWPTNEQLDTVVIEFPDPARLRVTRADEGSVYVDVEAGDEVELTFTDSADIAIFSRGDMVRVIVPSVAAIVDIDDELEDDELLDDEEDLVTFPVFASAEDIPHGDHPGVDIESILTRFFNSGRKTSNG